MNSYKSNSIVKLRSYKNDIAPVGFYFDFFPTDLFKIPILPIPLRIDKLTNGEPTLFIPPDVQKMENVCEKLGLIINYKLFYLTAIQNLIKYAKLKNKQLTLRNVELKYLKRWWRLSNNMSATNPDLTESFTFINSQFVKTYKNLEENILDSNHNAYTNALIDYCDTIINYFRNKIESNVFKVNKDNKIKEETLYLEKKNKFFPLIIKIPVHNKINNKDYEMGFVPYLIYDDLLDCFYYNKKLLKSNKKNTLNLKVYKNNEIINTRTNITDIKLIESNLKTEIKDIIIDNLL